LVRGICKSISESCWRNIYPREMGKSRGDFLVLLKKAWVGILGVKLKSITALNSNHRPPLVVRAVVLDPGTTDIPTSEDRPSGVGISLRGEKSSQRVSITTWQFPQHTTPMSIPNQTQKLVTGLSTWVTPRPKNTRHGQARTGQDSEPSINGMANPKTGKF